jgi:hypothetical protein
MSSETVELRGHIIDSLILPKVLDEILTRGATFKIGEIRIGQKRVDQSYARIEVSSPSADTLAELLLRLRQHGAEVIDRKPVELAPAPADGIFPDEFYVTTNQQTFVRIDEGKEIPVDAPMMDSAIAVDRQQRSARSVKFYDVRKATKSWSASRASGCSRQSAIPPPRASLISRQQSPPRRRRARSSVRSRARFSGYATRRQDPVVAGPSVVHTAPGSCLEKLITLGYVQRLFTATALPFTMSKAPFMAPRSA